MSSGNTRRSSYSTSTSLISTIYRLPERNSFYECDNLRMIIALTKDLTHVGYRNCLVDWNRLERRTKFTKWIHREQATANKNKLDRAHSAEYVLCCESNDYSSPTPEIETMK